MTDKKPIVKKPKKPKIPEGEKLTAKLLTYTVKTLISTGEYSNIQIEMVVTDAHDLADAQNLIELHVDALHKRYYNILTKKPETNPITGTGGSAPATPIAPAPAGATPGPTISSGGKTEVLGANTVEQEEAFKKAEIAVRGARTVEALDALAMQIKESVRLVAKQKSDLFAIIQGCREEIK